MAAAESESQKVKRKFCKKLNRLRETLLKKENISSVESPSLVNKLIFVFFSYSFNFAILSSAWQVRRTHQIMSSEFRPQLFA